MKRTLVIALAGTLVAIVVGCGGGGGGGPVLTPTPTPTPTSSYGAISSSIQQECEYLVGAIAVGRTSQSSVSNTARSNCQTRANRLAQAAGVSAVTCSQPVRFSQCAAYAAGENSRGGCWLTGATRSSRSVAEQDARNVCERELGGSGAGASCRVLNSACTSDASSPPVGDWTPSPGASDDHSDSLADATVVAVGRTLSARIDSATDVDYFRLRISQTGTLTVWTSGEAATDLTLLDGAGNELQSGSRSRGLGTLSVGVNTVRPANEGRNVSSLEIAVREGATVFAKVVGRSVGSYTFGSRIIRAGVSNVVTGTPQISFRAGATQRVELATHFNTSQAQAAVTYSATFVRPVLVGGVLVGVALSVEGSIMTLISQESGPAYSGTVGIRVEVRDPFGLFAVKVLDIEFTREEAPGARVTINGINIPSSSCVSGYDFSGSRSYRIPEMSKQCIQDINFNVVNACSLLVFAKTIECLDRPEVTEAKNRCKNNFNNQRSKCG